MSNPVIQSAPKQVSIVQKGTVAPRGAEPGLPTDTPLETNIGMGYDVFASGGKDVRMPVYEMGVPTKAATSETGYDIMAPKNTKCTGLSATNTGYSYTKQYAKTAEEMSQYLAVSAGIEGTVGAFKGSLEGSFSTKVTSDVTQLFTLLETVVQRYQFTLTGGSGFTDDFTKAVNGLEGKTWASDASAFETFFDDYGTHVVTGIIMGAKLSVYVLTTTETHVTTWDLKVNLEASYGTISGEGEGTYNDKQTQVKEATDAQGSASGGDITLAAGVIVNDTFNKDAYLAWVSSVSAADWPLQMAEITYTLSPINSHLPDGVSKDLTSELAKAFKAYCQAQAKAANLPTGTPVVVSIQLLDMHVINDADQHSPGEFFWDFTLLNQQGTTIGTLSSVARAAYVSGLTDGTTTTFPTLIKKAKEAAGKDADKDVIGNGSVNLQFYPDDVSASFKVLGTLTEVDAGSSNDDFNPYDSSQTVELPPAPAAAAPKLSLPTKLVFDVAHFYGAQDKTGKARTYTMNFAGVNGGPGNVQVTYQISFSPPLP